MERSGLEDLIEALTILARYDHSRTGWPTHCEHDVLYVTCVGSEVTEEDRRRLEALGFFWEEDHDAWYSFRFGSC